jgi:hypothetical protein
MRSFAVLLFVLLLITSCHDGGRRLDVDLSGIPDPEIQVHQYGRDLFSIDPGNLGEELPALAREYPFFLGEPPFDTLSYIQIHDFITDPFLREIAAACDSVFPDIGAVAEQLDDAFRHYRYYYPGAEIPEIFTYVSGLDFEYPVQLHDGIMIIAIDMYLGRDFRPYAMARIPRYRSLRATPAYLTRDVMLEVGRQSMKGQAYGSVLLDKMIEQGKLLYFLEAMLPDVDDTIRIAYTKRQLDWCIDNEANLWAFLIENELLFSSDFEKTHKLIIDGPFTSYFPKGSPARTGWWVGWQIVRNYMKNNPEAGIPQLMEELPPREILDNSGYNP